MTISGPVSLGLCGFIIIYLSIQAFPNCKRYFAKRRKNMKAVEYQIDTEGVSDISQPYNACQNINRKMCPFVDPKILEHEKELHKQPPIEDYPLSEYQLPSTSVLLPDDGKSKYIARKNHFSIVDYQIPNNRPAKIIQQEEDSALQCSSFTPKT